jgi:hypothetical protein
MATADQAAHLSAGRDDSGRLRGERCAVAELRAVAHLEREATAWVSCKTGGLEGGLLHGKMPEVPRRGPAPRGSRRLTLDFDVRSEKQPAEMCFCKTKDLVILRRAGEGAAPGPVPARPQGARPRSDQGKAPATLAAAPTPGPQHGRAVAATR